MDGKQSKTPMNEDAKRRIMSAEGNVQKGSFEARAQSAADKNANKK